MSANPGRRPHDLELAERARALRADGLKYREIVAVLGVPRSTISQWCLDPDGNRAKTRRQKYRGECLECGASTYSGSLPAPKRCAPCTRDKQSDERHWTPERIIAALKSWSQANGGDSPRAKAWLSKRPPGMPYVQAVQREFGSWSNGLRAAGLQPGIARGGPPGSTPREEYERTAELYRAGMGTTELAELLGITAHGVLYRLRYVGEPIRGSGNRPRVAEAEFAEAWNEGLPARELMERFGYSKVGSVYNRARELGRKGYPIDWPRHKREPRVGASEFIAAWNAGLSGRELMERFGYSNVVNVYSHAHRLRKKGYSLIRRKGGPRRLAEAA